MSNDSAELLSERDRLDALARLGVPPSPVSRDAPTCLCHSTDVFPRARCSIADVVYLARCAFLESEQTDRGQIFYMDQVHILPGWPDTPASNPLQRIPSGAINACDSERDRAMLFSEIFLPLHPWLGQDRKSVV